MKLDELISIAIRFLFTAEFACKHNFPVHESYSLNKVRFESYW